MKKFIPQNFSRLSPVLLAIISTNFWKKRNDPYVIIKGPGDTDLWQKPEVENNLVSDSI